MCVRGGGKHSRKCRLAGSGRAPKDHRSEATAFDGDTERAPGANKVSLPYDLVERGGAHSRREWSPQVDRIRRSVIGLGGVQTN